MSNVDWNRFGKTAVDMWGYITLGQLFADLFRPKYRELALVMLVCGLMAAVALTFVLTLRRRPSPPYAWLEVKWDSPDGPAVLRVAPGLAAAKSPETDKVLWVIKNAIDGY